MCMAQDVMDEDEKGKLFVGGLSYETTQENLQRYFSRFGEVIDCVVMKNNESGRSRGFGFVTFADPNNVVHVLQSGPHNLDGSRTIDPKPCNPRTLQKPKKGGGYPKVFLGGLKSDVTETDLRLFFGRYGKVMEVVIMYDQEQKKSRGFGFLSFEDEASVERVTNEHYINLNGKQVEIKKAEPRDGFGANKMNNDTNQWGLLQGAPFGVTQGPNGRMGGPSMNVTTMGAPNMMQGYQGWGTSLQQQSYGYGTPSAPGSYQGWGAPPGPQGPPPHQWSNYATAQLTQGYSSYGPSGASGGANWNTWNMPQNSAGTGGSSAMYSRAQSGARAPSASGPGGGMPPIGPANSASKTGSDYGGYGTAGYGNYTNDQGSSYGPRSACGSDNTSQPPYPAPQPQVDRRAFSPNSDVFAYRRSNI